MPRLLVTGDSFSTSIKNDRNPRTWMEQVATLLGNWELVNCSIPGSCQDWHWQFIELNEDDITPDDQIVIALTDPSRYWFFEDEPGVTNSHIINFDTTITDPEKLQAVELFIKHLQRDNLDYQHSLHRLGWLNNIVRLKGWRKPLIIHGANRFKFDKSYFDFLTFSNGNLTMVSFLEKGEEKIPFRGVDMRYNHLCLSNHDILADKIVDTILNGVPLDLTTGFIENIYVPELLNGNVSDELSRFLVEDYKQSTAHEHRSWFKRFGWTPQG